jgi:hypothetical protein
MSIQAASQSPETRAWWPAQASGLDAEAAHVPRPNVRGCSRPATILLPVGPFRSLSLPVLLLAPKHELTKHGIPLGLASRRGAHLPGQVRLKIARHRLIAMLEQQFSSTIIEPTSPIYRMGLRFHTPIIAGQSAEYCCPSTAACSMSRKTLCIRASVVIPNAIALGKRLRHKAW